MVPTVFFSRLLVDVSIIYAKPAFIDRFHERVTSIKPDDLDDHWHHGRSTLGELVYLVFVE